MSLAKQENLQPGQRPAAETVSHKTVQLNSEVGYLYQLTEHEEIKMSIDQIAATEDIDGKPAFTRKPVKIKALNREGARTYYLVEGDPNEDLEIRVTSQHLNGENGTAATPKREVKLSTTRDTDGIGPLSYVENQLRTKLQSPDGGESTPTAKFVLPAGDRREAVIQLYEAPDGKKRAPFEPFKIIFRPKGA